VIFGEKFAAAAIAAGGGRYRVAGRTELGRRRARTEGHARLLAERYPALGHALIGDLVAQARRTGYCF